ncbi:hypothetical protein DFP92_107173 [Yoonia sediminilitoris]|uniref:Uncharacterized protein n=1 Tax=Yoonia sediminilitoris TaxID=1286148 RepID=A0A2T6KF02_9RHOB|nr:hypothetical protein C8N45_107173 [Yoonia sediminilitoris]RCW94882.1 hypothetical protein DFP92_107173 [Yoonia sediminilitoris]
MPVRTGSNFEMKTENGKQVWYWTDKVGSQCGSDRKWRYEVQVGDSVRRDAGTCPDGSKWAEMTISALGNPVQV